MQDIIKVFAGIYAFHYASNCAFYNSGHFLRQYASNYAEHHTGHNVHSSTCSDFVKDNTVKVILFGLAKAML